MPSCLVVDDSRVVRAVARRILEELEMDVTEAENGQVALDRVDNRINQDRSSGFLAAQKIGVSAGYGFIQLSKDHVMSPVCVGASIRKCYHQPAWATGLLCAL